MNKLLFLSCYFVISQVLANPVHDWWRQCKGSDPESTCLSEQELSKFKTICSSKNLKDDCALVVDYVVAKNRIAEGRQLLLSGYASQKSHFVANKKYLMANEEVWTQDDFSHMHSFAAGVLPSCKSRSKNKLKIGKNLRPELKGSEKMFEKIYESLETLPCPENKDGFILVTIGKVKDSISDFEVFTLDEKKNFKVIQTGLSAGPFLTKKSN